MRGLGEDQNIIIKPADKGSCVVVWDPEDYLAKPDKQLKDNETYESSGFKDADLVNLIEKSNSIFHLFEKGNSLLKRNLSISLINIKRPPISEKCTYCLRSISVLSMGLVVLLYQTAVRLLRKLPNF